MQPGSTGGKADLPAEDASSSALNADGVPSDGGAQEPPADSSEATAGSSASAAYHPSKKAMKRAKKDEYFAARKQAKKMEIKEEKAQRRAAAQARWETLSPEEQAELKRQAAEKSAQRTAAQNEEAAARAAMEHRALPTCVVDLSFDELMNDREIASLAQQLSYCHSANRRSAFPMRLAFTSVGGKLEAKLKSGWPGWRNWAIRPEPRHYLEAFPEHSSIVYLSSESDEVLDTLDSSEVYVVGGLVDHNKQKGLTHRLASEANVRTARLPIDEYMSMSQRRVLAVNHVVEILTLRASGLDWTSVLTKVMPQRREATARGVGQEVGLEEGEQDGGEEEDGGGDDIGQKQKEEWEEGGAT